MQALPGDEFKKTCLAIMAMQADEPHDRPDGVGGVIYDMAVRDCAISKRRAQAARIRAEKPKDDKENAVAAKSRQKSADEATEGKGKEKPKESAAEPPKRMKQEYSEEVIRMTETVIEYLNRKAGTSYRAGKDSKSHVSARMRDGMTEADFKTVVDKKVDEWKNDDRMRAYLRPSTLFGTKMEQYLGQAPAKRGGSRFDNFTPRGYDMGALEGKLIGGL